ncbi:uncharacterized protein LOC135837608 [Planococcus citri]|uniref:uncharacterized protein LOC135837608 n=1 Tax=Planococcus citri TaxID=170843 RepID=UPI0031F7B786
MEILCFDASGSTGFTYSDFENQYWNTIEDLSKSNQFDALLSWSNDCRRVSNVLESRASGGTNPTSFIDYILREFNKDFIEEKFGSDAGLVLQVTTDGQINDYQIKDCADYLRKPNFPRLKKITIHYIGPESSMNFGLNAIFGSVADLSFTINDIHAAKPVPSAEELENYEDIFSSEFLSFLCSRVTDLKSSNFEAFDRLRRTLIARLDKQHSNLNKPISPKEYFDQKDAAGLENAIKEKLFATDHTEFQNWKNKILSCFDKVSNISLADCRARGDLNSTVLTEPDVVDDYESEDVLVEDSITFVNINEGKVCILLKFDQPALFEPDSKYVRNPLLVFQDEDIRSKLIKRFELHPLSISTVKQLVKGNTIVSPFTRDICRAFILGPANTNEINFNSAALISLFKSEKQDKIYGDKALWQLVILYLLKTHIDSTVKRNESVTWPRDELLPLVNVILREFILNEKLLYHLTLHIKIQLPVARVPLYVTLWYIIAVAPNFCANNSRNILRYPGASILLNLFEDANLTDVIPLDEESRIKLHFRMKLWKLWSDILGRKNDIDLELTFRAAYQNYCIVQNKIVLLSGARPDELPPPEIVSGIPAAIVQNMWTSLSHQSKRTDAINENVDSLKPPKIIFAPHHDDGESEEVYHMRIDPNTLRCTEICPVTGKPSMECAGPFDFRSESYARIFSLFCERYERYPESSDELVILHNRKRAIHNVSSAFIVNYMKHVFEIYQPIAKSMTCEEFNAKYKQYGDLVSKERYKK